MSQEYDAIIVGGGQAGPSLAARLAASGRKVALIERKYLGGTCVNVGCMPTKTMVASAYVAHMAARASDYGVEIPTNIHINMHTVKARKDTVSLNARHNIERWLQEMDNCTVLHGHAHFVSPHELEVDGQRLRAPQIFLNVGARADVPPVPGLDQISYLTSSSILDLNFVPRHLIVVGGGYIGLEFAQMFRRFGARVTILQRNARLAPLEDEDVSETMRDILEREGIDVRLNVNGLRFEPIGDDAVARFEVNGTNFSVVGSHVLIATGRRPNTDTLGLPSAGINTDRNGYIEVDDKLRTSAPDVWALGDCNGRGGYTHTSYNDYEIVAANLLDGEDRRVSQRYPAYGIYTDPPLGRVGMTEAQVRRSGRKAVVGKRPMSRVGRAVERDETLGLMKIIADANSGEILGASIFGVGGDEAIHSLIDAMYAGATVATLRKAVHIHPTVAELIPTVLGEMRPLSP